MLRDLLWEKKQINFIKFFFISNVKPQTMHECVGAFDFLMLMQIFLFEYILHVKGG